ncbi:MAG: YihY/virulence factor BrkB family protein [Oscillospiraceae bacterium]|nr:YihY/virulence factor BrkB family protein [Oscillospiraceae bacterium]
MKKLRFFSETVFRYYNNRQIPLASAALSYYLTMTFFPLVICLYTLLGNNYAEALEVLSFVESFLSEGAVRSIRTFLDYVARNHSTGMFYAGATVMVTSASAAVRSMQVTIGRMQGGRRFIGIRGLLFSVLFSLLFLAATYFAILVMFTGKDLLALVNEHIPFLDFGNSWLWLRYLLLFGIMFLIFWAVFRVSRLKRKTYTTWAGALVATLGMIAVSMIFSRFIAVSARYSVVYGSLASVILLMYWIYLVCQIIYIGAAFNLTLQEWKEREK